MSKSVRRLLGQLAICLFVAGLATEISDRLFSGNTFAQLVTIFVATLLASMVVWSIYSRKIGRKRSRSKSRRRRAGSSQNTSAATKDAPPRDTQSDRKNESTKTTRDSGTGKSRQSDRTSGNQSRQRRRRPSRNRPDGEAERQTGVIKSYSDRQLYGFISIEDGSDIFFHKSCLNPEFNVQQLKQGTKITFFTKEDERGHYADDIQLNLSK